MEYTGSSVADFEVIFEAGWSAEIIVHCFELLLEYTGSSVADFEVIFEAAVGVLKLLSTALNSYWNIFTLH